MLEERFGLQLVLGPGYGYDARYSIGDMVSFAKRAEEAGAEMLIAPTWEREPLVPFAAIAQATNRIELATVGTDIYTNNPVSVARIFANLNELSGGRSIVGLARGTQLLRKEEGVRFNHVLPRMREFITILRGMGGGERFNFDGEYFKVHRSIGFKPSISPPRIFVATYAPKMLELAGELADGVFLPTACFPEYVQDVIEHVRIGEAKGERNPGHVRIVGSTLLSVSDNREKARDRVRPIMVFYFAKAAYDYLVSLSPFQREVELIRRHVQEGNEAAAAQSVTDSMIDACAITGTLEDCKGRLSRFRDLEITTHRIVPLAENPQDALESTLRLISSQHRSRSRF